jgi:hypothetical protein
LPTHIKKYTVNRSVHTDKKSREQFEMRIHKRLIDILEPTAKTVEEMMKLDLPAGVDVEIKLNGVLRGRCPFFKKRFAVVGANVIWFGPKIFRESSFIENEG